MSGAISTPVDYEAVEALQDRSNLNRSISARPDGRYRNVTSQVELIAEVVVGGGPFTPPVTLAPPTASYCSAISETADTLLRKLAALRDGEVTDPDDPVPSVNSVKTAEELLLEMRAEHLDPIRIVSSSDGGVVLIYAIENAGFVELECSNDDDGGLITAVVAHLGRPRERFESNNVKHATEIVRAFKERAISLAD